MIVVTGGSGFLGTHVVAELHKRGHETFVPRSVDFDLRSWEDTKRLPDADAVIHLAATCGGIGANQAAPADFFRDNITMGLNIVARYSDTRFIGIGTVCSYPKHALTPFREARIWDGYPEETNAPYGLAKKMLMVQLEAQDKQYGMDYTYLIPTNLYGPHDHFDLEKSHVIPAMIRKMLTQDRVVLWGDGSPTRDFLYVCDAARAIVDALGWTEKGPINIGSGREVSMAELASTIACLTDFKGEIVWDTTKPNGQPRRQLDISKARELGWEPTTDLRTGLGHTIRWYK